MASVAISAVPVAVTIPAGTPVTVSVAATLGYSSATAASGPSMAANTPFAWPGPSQSQQTLWVQAASAGTLNYIS